MKTIIKQLEKEVNKHFGPGIKATEHKDGWSVRGSKGLMHEAKRLSPCQAILCLGWYLKLAEDTGDMD